MNSRLEDILDECVYLIRSGQETMEGCLAKYPDVREKLEPLLRTTVLIQAVPQVLPSPTFKKTLRQRFIKAVEARQVEEITSTPGLLPTIQKKWTEYGRKSAGVRNFMVRAVVVLLIATLVGSGTVAASANSLPGSPLYPVKIASERAQLALTFNDNNQAKLHLKFAERRLGEVQALITKGKSEDIDTPLSIMNQHLEQAQNIAAAASGRDKQELYSKILELTERQQTVLEVVSEQVPDQAREAINHAMEVSRRGHEKAESALKKKKTPKQPQPSKPAPETPGGKIPSETPAGEVPPETPGSQEVPSETPPGESKDYQDESHQDSSSPTPMPDVPETIERP